MYESIGTAAPLGVIPGAMLGTQELLIILALVLILFGAGKLPQVFTMVGKGIKSFRDAQRDDAQDDPPRRSFPNESIDATEVGSREKEHAVKR